MGQGALTAEQEALQAKLLAARMKNVAKVYVGAKVLSSVMGAISNYQQQEALEQQHRYNAKIAEYEAQKARVEYAQNASIYRSKARRATAGAENAMSGTGNIGSTADAVALESMFNLSKDLSALKYNYDNKAISALNEAAQHEFNAEVARHNRTSAVIGGVVDTVASAGGATAQTYAWGLWGKKNNGGS